MKRTTLYSLVIALVMAACCITPVTRLAAQALNFSSVISFSTEKGRLAFFDQSTGKLYVYDSEGKACLFQGQLKELGKPFEDIQKISSAPAVERKLVPGTKVMISNKGEKTVILDGPRN